MDSVPPMAYSVDRMPEPLDTLVAISCPGKGGCHYHLEFQPTRLFYSRHLLALVPSLLRWAMQIAWQDFKGMVRGAPKRSVQTVREFQGGYKQAPRGGRR